MNEFTEKTVEHVNTSDTGLQKLAEGRDIRSKELAAFLETTLQEVLTMLHRKFPEQKDLVDLCNVASSELHKRLQAAGFNARIFEGDVELADNDWLQHRVNLIFLDTQWVVIDVTASQLPWLKNQTPFIGVFDGNKDTLKQYMKTIFHWWSESKKLSE